MSSSSCYCHHFNLITDHISGFFQQWEIVAFLLSLCSRHQLSCIIDNTVKVVIFHHKQPSTRTVLDCPHSNSFVNMIKYNVIFNEPIYYLSQPPPS